MKHLLSLAVLFCTCFPAETNAQNWVNTNGPQRVNAVRDIANGKSESTQKLYVADETHVRFSTNGGTIWDSTSSLVSSPVVIDCKPSSSDWVISAGTGNNVWQSTDGGSSWTNQTTTSDLVPLRLSISTASSDIAFLGADTINRNGTWTSSLWKTADGGQSWTAQNYFRDSVHTNIRGIAYHQYDASRLWVCGTAGSPNDMTVNYGVELESESIKPYGIWFTSNGGTNWARRVSGMSNTEAKNVTTLVLSVPNGTSDTLLFSAVRTTATGNAKFFKSTNFGVDWVELTNVFPSGTKDVRVLRMKPGSVDTMIAATDFGFLFSSTRGSSWSQRVSGLTEFDVRQVVFDKNDPLTVYAATAGGVFKSTDLGNNWSSQIVNTSIVITSSIAALSNNLFTTSASASVVNLSTNAGSSWDLGSVIGRRRFGGYHASINQNYSGYAYACGDSTIAPDDVDGVIYTTTNGGSSWAQVFSRTSSTEQLRFHQVIADPKKTSQRVYAIGKTSTTLSQPNFFYSTNKGVAWAKTQGVPIRSNQGADTSLCLIVDSTGTTTNSQTMYAGLASGLGVYRSIDGGASWSSRGLSGKTIRSLAFKQSSAQMLYAGATEGLFKSTDGGANWGSALRTDVVTRVLYHPSYSSSTAHLWVIGEGGNRIFKTTDSGSSWDSVNTSTLPKPLSDLRRDPSNDSLFYVTTGSGVYRINPAPEKTTGLSVSGSYLQNPTIDWTDNAESDLAGYKLYRTGCDNWSYQLVAVIGSDSSIYTDPGVVVGNGSGDRRYYIVAFDNQNNHATASDVLIVDCSAVDWRNTYNPVETEELPREFSLSENFPNPFNPVTTIRYALPKDVHVTLTVFDLIGREVIRLIDESQVAGFKSVAFDATNMASGVYLYKLTAGSFTDTKKMIVTK